MWMLLKYLFSDRTHLLVYECKQICSDLLEDEVEVEIMWIPGHVRLKKRERGQTGTKSGIEWCF
jgi:hypothetical protein